DRPLLRRRLGGGRSCPAQGGRRQGAAEFEDVAPPQVICHGVPLTWCGPVPVSGLAGGRSRVSGPRTAYRAPVAAATARLMARPRRSLLVGVACEPDDGLGPQRRQGWSLGEFAKAAAWHVQGTRGGESFHTTVATQAAGRAVAGGPGAGGRGRAMTDDAFRA